MHRLLDISRSPDPLSPGERVRLRGGEVWLVGAGPGDAGLITVMGREALLQADVIVHDRLGCEEILQEVRPGTHLIDVGKTPGGKRTDQEEICQTLAQHALAGARVVRLKGGDPLVFGRGMEEVLYLRAAGVASHVIPGITSAVAAPAAAGIPPTHRELARSFAVGTGRDKDGAVPSPAGADTRIYLMAVSTIPTIAAELMELGLSTETPAAIVMDATSYRERIVRATLGSIASIARSANVRPPAVLIIGETAGLAISSEPQENILVTSTRISPILSEHRPNARFVWRPLYRITSIAEATTQRAIVSSLETDWVVFNNPYAVRGYFHGIRDAGFDARRLRANLAVVGSEAAAALEEFALTADFVAMDGRTAGLAEILSEELNGKRVAFPCSDVYRGGLLGQLSRAGATEIMQIPVYTRLANKPASIDWAHIQSVFFASGSAISRLQEEFPGFPAERLAALCIGESTCAAARRAGFIRVENIADRRSEITGIEATA